MLVALLGSSRDEMEETLKASALKVMEFLQSTSYDFVLGGASGGIMRKAYDSFYEKGHKIFIMQSLNRKKEEDDIDPLYISPQKDNFERTRSIYEKSDVILFLPGGVGTYAELFSILDYEEETKNQKPIFLYNETGYFDSVINLLHTGVKENTIHARVIESLYKEVRNIKELEMALKNRKEENKWKN